MAKDIEKDFEELEDDVIVLYNEATDKDEKFYVLDVMDHKGKQYVVMQPAEHLDDISDDELLIYELGDEDDEENFLIPIAEEDRLQEVFDEFMKKYEEFTNAYEESKQANGCAGCSSASTCNLADREGCTKK